MTMLNDRNGPALGLAYACRMGMRKHLCNRVWCVPAF